jgi:small subunit ribosomal protein S18
MFKKMRPRKKVCYFTKNHIKFVDYKDIELLSRFVNPDGKIAPRSSTGTSAKYPKAGRWSVRLIAGVKS